MAPLSMVMSRGKNLQLRYDRSQTLATGTADCSRKGQPTQSQDLGPYVWCTLCKGVVRLVHTRSHGRCNDAILTHHEVDPLRVNDILGGAS